MSSGSLPQYVEPFRLSDANARVSGGFPAQRLQRISEFSLGTTDDIRVDLEFSRDAEKRCRVSGSVDTVMHVTCERCLGPLDVNVHADVSLMLVPVGATIPETAEDVDVLEVEDGRLLLVSLIEEEVMLAMPRFPVHDVCDMVTYDRGENETAASVVVPAVKSNPFEVLASLKQKK